VAQPVARKAAESAAEHNTPLRRVKRQLTRFVMVQVDLGSSRVCVIRVI
jgi:hypothetical protein